MAYSYKQWSAGTDDADCIRNSDCMRWKDGIEAAGGSWTGSFIDGEDSITFDELNALETELHRLNPDEFAAKVYLDKAIPGIDEWNRIENCLAAIVPEPIAFAIYSDTDSSLTFYTDSEVPEEGGSYQGKNVTAVYTGFDTATYTGTSQVPWYSNRSNVTTVAFDSSFLQVRCVATAYWFYNHSTAKTWTGLGNIDTSSVTTMLNMFYNCTSLTDISALADWDTAAVTDMNSMFSGCTGLTDISALSGWVTSSVTNMSYMFYGCTGLTDVSGMAGWVTSSVTNMSYMFRQCTGLTDVSGMAGWDTAKVTNMSYMFYGCTGLTDVSGMAGWVTSSVTDMSYMFRQCTGLTDVSGMAGWVTFSVTDMNNMFYNCTGLTDVSGLANWDTSAVMDMSYMFSFCSSLTDVSAITNWDVSSVEIPDNIFEECSQLTTIDLREWNNASFSSMNFLFYNCVGLKTIYSDDSVFKTKNKYDDEIPGDEMFGGCESLVGGNGTKFDDSKTDSSMAHVDTEDNPGYFTQKE